MTFPAGDPDAEVMTLWRIRYWCNLAFFSRGSKKKHMSCHPVAADLPDEAAILHGKLPDEWVGDDEEVVHQISSTYYTLKTTSIANPNHVVAPRNSSFMMSVQ